MQLFAKNVTIDASPQCFVFECDGRSETFETRLWLRGDRIEGVGAEGPAGCDPLVLFGDSAKSSWVRDRPDFLSTFLQYGIVQVLGRGVWIRPIVHFRGLSSFEGLLGGYQKAVFSHALEPAPVSEVRFADEGPTVDS